MNLALRLSAFPDGSRLVSAATNCDKSCPGLLMSMHSQMSKMSFATFSFTFSVEIVFNRFFLNSEIALVMRNLAHSATRRFLEVTRSSRAYDAWSVSLRIVLSSWSNWLDTKHSGSFMVSTGILVYGLIYYLIFVSKF